MRRSTWWIIGGLGALAAAVAVGVAVLVLRGDDRPGPERAVERFLTAWQEQAPARIARLTDAPRAVVVRTYGEQALDLGGWPTAIRLVGIEDEGDVAVARFRVTFALAPDRPWSYRGTIPWRRVDGRWRAHWTPAAVHPDLTPTTRFRLTRTWAPRAPILAEDGTPLTTDAEVVTIGIEPRRMTSRDDVKAALGRYVGVDPTVVDRSLDAPGVQPDHFVAIVTVPAAQYEAVKPQIYPVPGLVFRRSAGRQAATPQLAAHVVGGTGPISAEMLDELGAPYDQASVVGQGGLEQAFERRLAGTPTTSVALVDSVGEVDREVRTWPGRPPAAVRTTLDLASQRRAEAAVGSAAPAAMVVVRPSDGAVRAVVSTPITTPFDRALDGAYPPGSTFKVVTSAALLANGVTPDTTTSCPATLVVNGRTFKNFEGEAEPSLTFRRAFALSCNNAFIGLVGTLPAEALSTAARQFGFGARPALGVPAQGGSFPDPADATDRAAASIGQGRVTASPLTMAGVAGTVAAGEWHPPVLVLEPAPDAAPGATALDPGVVASLRELMTEVVRNGTGTAAAIPGQDVAGKTGTAEFGDADPPETHAWFIGFRGDEAFAVVVEGGGVGGRVAAPLARAYLASG